MLNFPLDRFSQIIVHLSQSVIYHCNKTSSYVLNLPLTIHTGALLRPRHKIIWMSNLWGPVSLTK